MQSRFIAAIAASTLVFTLASQASAQSITTLFANNNSGSAGGAVYFNVTVAANSLTVLRFDVNTTAAAGTPFGFQVYTAPTTYVGNEANAGAWTLMATGSGTSNGLNVASGVSLNSTFNLSAGTTYGMALVLAGPEGSVSHAYTNGTGANQAYSNADLSLALGAASNVPFTAPSFTPRVWNGTIYYSQVPEPATMAVLGIGVLAVLRRRRK